MSPFRPNDAHLKMLGREVWNKLPQMATEILRPYLTVVPYDTDFKKIESFYLVAFCKDEGIGPEHIRGALFKSSKVDIRRLFIAAMVHIYCPHVYYQHANEINLSKKGFVMWLARAVDQHESNVSILIREVVAWEKSTKWQEGHEVITEYDRFKWRLNSIVEKLKK